MKKSLNLPVLMRVSLIAVLIVLIGLTPVLLDFNRDLERAELAAARGSFAEASTHLESAATRMPWRTSLWERAAHHAFLANDPQRAKDLYEKAQQGVTLGGDSLSPQGWYELGQVCLDTGDVPGALDAWNRAAAAPDWALQALKRRAQVYISLGEYTLAVKDLQSALQHNQGDAEVYFLLALLLAPEDTGAALDYLDNTEALDPSLAEAVAEVRGKILAAQLAGEPAYSLVEMGRALASQGAWDLAEAVFRRAVAIRPDYAEAWAYLGEATQHTVDSEDAPATGVEELQKAIELNPDSVAAWTFLSLYWSRQGAYTKAVNALQHAIGLDPQNPVLYVELGNLRASTGDLDAAYEEYQHAVDLSGGEAFMLRNLVEFSLRYDYRVSEVALPAARRAVMLKPGDPIYLDLLAQVFLQLNDLNTALRFLQQALQIDALYPPAHLHLGMLYLLRGENDLATSELTQVITLEPSGVYAAQAKRLLEDYFP